MNEERKKLEAVGDGLLLACARMYLREQHKGVPYKIHTRLISRMVRNTTLTEIATGEGIRGLPNEKLSDAFEVAIALHYYSYGFDSCRLWLFSLFDKHFNLAEEVRRIFEPEEEEIYRQVRGALKQAMNNQGGRITDIEKATRQVISNLQNGSGL